jgi:chromosome segregation ATPase/uncharacterized protein YqgV (UPF0045/DUF77 family)
MKLLYFANERLDAQNLATALRTIAPNCTVSWTSRIDRATKWIAENNEFAVLVVESQIDGDSWHSLLQSVRGFAPRPAVFVIVPEGTGTAPASTVAGADYYVERNSPRFHDLSSLVARAMAPPSLAASAPSVAAASPPSLPVPSAPRDTELERKLAEATASLAEAERRHAAAMAAAAEQLAARQLQYEVATAGTEARWEVVEEQLRAAAIEAEAARQDYASAAAKIDRLSQRETELSAQLAAAAAKRDALERQLGDASKTIESTQARAEHEQRRAAELLADRQRELKALSDAQLNLEAALRASRQDHESSAAEVERLGLREAELSSTLADIRARHANVERRLAATEAAFQEADARATRERLAATKKAATREAELEGQARQEREARGDLERALAEAETARLDVQQRFDREVSQSAADRVRLTEHVSEVERALAQARAEHQSAAAEVTRLSQHEADLSSRLAGVVARLADVEAACKSLESQLTESGEKAAGLDAQIQQERTNREAALAAAAEQLAEQTARADRELSQAVEERKAVIDEVERLRQREADQSAQIAGLDARLAESDRARQTVEGRLAQAIDNAAAREGELDARITDERTARTDLEQAFAEAEAAWSVARQEYDSALAGAAHTLAEHRARSDREQSQAAAERDRLTGQLLEGAAALARARAHHDAATAEVARLTQREAGLASQLASEAARLEQVEASRQATERQLTDQLTKKSSELDAANERAASEKADAAAVKADLEARLAREVETRQALERLVDETRAAAAAAERALNEGAREQQERLEAQLDQERAEQQKQQTALQETNAALARERDGLRQSLAAVQEQSRRLDAELRDVRTHLDEVAEAADANTRRLTAELAESGRLLEAARSEHQATVDQLFSEHASVVSAHRTEVEQVRERLAATARDLESTRQRLTVVQGEADTLPRLQRELEDGRAEIGRLFQQSALAIFRCTRNGEVRQANRTAMTLVGRRTIDEMRGAQFATAVFEDPNGLSWLIERCVSTRTRESIETTWRRKDGGRLFVRLSAYACAPDVVEIVAEDLTRVRVLQERLGQAHRMEAVGRLAADVAVTCGNLLNDVRQQVQEWSAAAGTSPVSQQGQQVLAEVTRAAALLRQVCAYGEEQARTPAVTDLNTVIQDLEPVLKRIAGNAVSVQLPRASSRLNVDIGSDRIERLLVHLASYGRSRMSSGGQLKIELGTTVVDRRFAAKHPNVRLGPHALITVTETRDAARRTAPPPSDHPDPKPRIDFGTLQSLVGGCGGHLWMTVQPEGDMVAKIRLPLLLPAHDEVAPRTLVARGGRALTRLFQH